MILDPDNLDAQMETLRERGLIDDEAEGSIRGFVEFLRVAPTWPENECGKKMVPEEWWPFIKGTGPAP